MGTKKGRPVNYAPEQIAAIVERYNAGDSARFIGARVGRSRGAILGLVHRLRKENNTVYKITREKFVQRINKYRKHKE